MRNIFSSCQHLRLPITTAITAMSLMHRFLQHTSIDLTRKTIEVTNIAAVILLSSKVDENIRTLREVIAVTRRFLKYAVHDAVEEDKIVGEFKANVVAQEQVILRGVSFQTYVDVPHKYLLNIARSLGLSCGPVYTSYGLMNDCFLYPQCISLRPATLSTACLYTAIECDIRQYSIPTSREFYIEATFPTIHKLGKKWWLMFVEDEDAFLKAVEFIVVDVQSSNTKRHAPDSSSGNRQSTSSACNNVINNT